MDRVEIKLVGEWVVNFRTMSSYRLIGYMESGPSFEEVTHYTDGKVGKKIYPFSLLPEEIRAFIEKNMNDIDRIFKKSSNP